MSLAVTVANTGSYLVRATTRWPFLSALVLLILFNFKSFPLVYHALAIGICTPIHIRLRFADKKHLIRADQSSSISFRVTLDDLDLNIHMNNSVYAKQMDFGRLKFMISLFGLQILPLVPEYRYSFLNGGTQFFFLKQLALFEKYTITTRLIAYSNKWFFLEHRFTTRNGEILNAIGLSKLVFKELQGKNRGKTVSPLEMLERSGHDIALLKKDLFVPDELVKSLPESWQIEAQGDSDRTGPIREDGKIGIPKFAGSGKQFAKIVMEAEALLLEPVL